MRPILLTACALLVALPAFAATFWRDNDRDGYGNAAYYTIASSMPPGYADNPNDCDDQDPNVHPGAPEYCNGRDENCNGAIDDGATPIPAYRDYDGDGYGQDATMVARCPVPAGYVIYGGDCNDADPRIHPSAIETCGNGIDDDCDGYVDEFCGAPFGIADVVDNPGDDGYAVRVRFHAHPYDVPAGAPVHVLEYRVQRRPVGVETVPYTWETVATLPATNLVDYEAVAPTWCNESPAGPCNVTFVVRAIADVPGVAYDTAPDSGTAVDDTAPAAPPSIAATWTPGQVRLDWGASPSADVESYRVYHDTGCDILPGCLPVVISTHALTFTGPFDGRTHYFHYWVTAVDTAGNESSAVMPSLVGVDPAGAASFAFAPPSPNPSRGEVAFSWTGGGRARLTIVDLAGRVVRSVEAVDGRAVWDGRDADGRNVRSGAYFARLESALGARTRMVVRLP